MHSIQQSYMQSLCKQDSESDDLMFGTAKLSLGELGEPAIKQKEDYFKFRVEKEDNNQMNIKKRRQQSAGSGETEGEGPCFQLQLASPKNLGETGEIGDKNFEMQAAQTVSLGFSIQPK